MPVLAGSADADSAIGFPHMPSISKSQRTYSPTASLNLSCTCSGVSVAVKRCLLSEESTSPLLISLNASSAIFLSLSRAVCPCLLLGHDFPSRSPAPYHRRGERP